MLEYTADFETVVNIKQTRVWLWAVCNLDGYKTETGNDIKTFISFCQQGDARYYFHNLKFDGEFIIYWLLTNGYTWRKGKKKDLRAGEFTTLISDMGQFYSMSVCWSNGACSEFWDSAKIINMKVKEMPRAFDIGLEKLEIEYSGDRPEGYQPTQNELLYVSNDVAIPAHALRFLLDKGLTKMTAASNAMANFRARFTNREWKRYFPKLDYGTDSDIRKSYKGGWTYANPKYTDVELKSGIVYDVNSMYPWAMINFPLPVGKPVYYGGKYEADELFPLYVQCISACFKLKPGKYPSIQIKHSTRFAEAEYITDTGDEPALLHLTNIDLTLLFECYDVYNIEYYGGYKFVAQKGLFDDYIMEWYGEKTKAREENNNALSTLAKLYLNSLYGKFGTNPKKGYKYPVYDTVNDRVQYRDGTPEITDGVYVPIAAFVTSYARDRIIRAANACGDRFAYADTDSLHIIGDDPPDIDISKTRLGAFKEESRFERACYHRSKCYIETINGVEVKKCAGMPEEMREYLTYDTMVSGTVFDLSGKLAGHSHAAVKVAVDPEKMKLRPVHVPGGIVLVPTHFTIK